MIQFIKEKFVSGIITLFGVSSLVFFLFSVLPGDPSEMMLDQRAGAEERQKVKQKFGFDLPLHLQYFFFINDLSPLSFHSKDSQHFTFYTPAKYGGYAMDFGNNIVAVKYPYLRTSFQKQGKPVTEIIAQTLPNTVYLALFAIGIAVVMGFFLGLVSGFYHNTWLDNLLQLLSTLGMSVPSFFSAILFAWIFGHLLQEYTGLNMTGSMYEMDDYGEENHLMLKNIVLPAIVLGIRPIAVVVQLVRSGIIEVLSLDYIRTARMKGLSWPKVLYKHALRNILNPVITALSGWFASMLAGAVFVEYVFGWRGLGKEVVTALNTLDIPVVTGIVLVIASLFILLNAMVEIAYVIIDPQVKFLKP